MPLFNDEASIYGDVQLWVKYLLNSHVIHLDMVSSDTWTQSPVIYITGWAM